MAQTTYLADQVVSDEQIQELQQTELAPVPGIDGQQTPTIDTHPTKPAGPFMAVATTHGTDLSRSGLKSER